MLPIVAALEALEAGDVRLCEAILLGALEDDDRPSAYRYRCDRCAFAGRWPGDLLAHRDKVGHWPKEDAQAA